ncbi:MAG: DUF885 family protein [Sphingomicrobium sp.]
MFNPQFSRREALGSIGAAGAFGLLGGCATIPPATIRSTSEADAVALLNSIAENLLMQSPESATSLGIDNGARAALRSRLADRSAAGQARIWALLRADLARANAIETASLTFATRTSVDVVRSAYRTALEGFALPYGDVAVGGWRNTPYVVIQNVGAYLDVPRFLDSDHSIANAADAEAYLARMDSFAVQLEGETARLNAATSAGAIPPAFLLDRAMMQMRASLDGAKKGGGLVESIERRTKAIPGNWVARARAIAQQKVAPALARQLAVLREQRRWATMDAGMWARPNGEAYYRWALKASTTTTMTPDEIHQLGIDTLARLHGEMDVILKKLGLTQGTVGKRMQALARDRRFAFPNNDAGRAEVLAYIQQRLGIIRTKMPDAFRTQVRGNLEVRRLPPEEEPGAPGAYGGAGSIDGTLPGKFWINLKPGFDHTRYNLPSLTHHEAIPGHVWQGEYANQLPLIRALLSFNAYSEGWALYAEQLADELGVYADFEAGRLGYLESIAFRACRLVVDTGLHSKRWTRERARAFFDEALGSPNESEVDRYCSWPGQACGYEVGHQEIDRQRTRARTALGARYDLRDFNDTVVRGGNVPMDVLASNIDDYIARGRV